MKLYLLSFIYFIIISYFLLSSFLKFTKWFILTKCDKLELYIVQLLLNINLIDNLLF